MLSKRLTATFAYKVAGAVPKVLYLGFDADEAKAALETAKDKGYFEIRVCRNIDITWMNRYRTTSPVVVRVHESFT